MNTRRGANSSLFHTSAAGSSAARRPSRLRETATANYAEVPSDVDMDMSEEDEMEDDVDAAKASSSKRGPASKRVEEDDEEAEEDDEELNEQEDEEEEAEEAQGAMEDDHAGSASEDEEDEAEAALEAGTCKVKTTPSTTRKAFIVADDEEEDVEDEESELSEMDEDEDEEQDDDEEAEDEEGQSEEDELEDEGDEYDDSVDSPSADAPQKANKKITIKLKKSPNKAAAEDGGKGDAKGTAARRAAKGSKSAKARGGKKSGKRKAKANAAGGVADVKRARWSSRQGAGDEEDEKDELDLLDDGGSATDEEEDFANYNDVHNALGAQPRTARQLAKSTGAGGDSENGSPGPRFEDTSASGLLQLDEPAGRGSKYKGLTESEIALKRSEMARRRKHQSDKKLEEEKAETINRLLKKQVTRSRGKVASSSAAAGASADSKGKDGDASGDEGEPDGKGKDDAAGGSSSMSRKEREQHARLQAKLAPRPFFRYISSASSPPDSAADGARKIISTLSLPAVLPQAEAQGENQKTVLPLYQAAWERFFSPGSVPRQAATTAPP